MIQTNEKYEEELLDKLLHVLSGKISSFAEEKEIIGDYFYYLGHSIQPEFRRSNINELFCDMFESTTIQLQEKASFFSPIVRKKIDHIIDDELLQQSVLYFSNKEDYEKLAVEYRVTQFLRALVFFLPSTWLRDNHDRPKISSNIILQAKINLKRLGKIVKNSPQYIPDQLHGDDFDPYLDLEDHFNPDFVNKIKMAAFVDLLRKQSQQMPENNIKIVIEQKIGNIESELKKEKPRWHIVIALTVGLLGVFADMKTLNSDIYDEPHRIAGNMLATFYEGGQVQKNTVELIMDRTLDLDRQSQKSIDHDEEQPTE
jgi:hypothetical protein